MWARENGNVKDCEKEGILCGNGDELNVPVSGENEEMVGERKEKSTNLEDLTYISTCIMLK